MNKKTVFLALALSLGLGSWFVYSRVKTSSLNQALCIAASQGDTVTVISLLQKSASPNAVGNIGDPGCDCEDNPSPAPALILAIFQTSAHTKEHFDTVAALLRAGANVNAPADGGMTALMWAQSPKMVKFLLEHGAKVDLRDDSGSTALMVASNGTNLDVVKALLKAGANVNAKNSRGETAFTLAYVGTNLAIPRTLAAAGANINTRDNEGKTALGHALEDNDVSHIEILKKLGVQP